MVEEYKYAYFENGQGINLLNVNGNFRGSPFTLPEEVNVCSLWAYSGDDMHNLKLEDIDNHRILCQFPKWANEVTFNVVQAGTNLRIVVNDGSPGDIMNSYEARFSFDSEGESSSIDESFSSYSTASSQSTGSSMSSVSSSSSSSVSSSSDSSSSSSSSQSASSISSSSISSSSVSSSSESSYSSISSSSLSSGSSSSTSGGAVGFVKTIKPDGGGDYTTLAAWEDYADDQASAAQWAECYDGTADLGQVLIDGWTGTPSSTEYPRIYAAPGERHDGTAGSSGAWIDVDTATNGIYMNIVSYTVIEGIRFELNYSAGAAYPIYNNRCDNSIIDGCLFVVVSANASSILIFLRHYTDGGPQTFTARNNVMYGNGTGSAGIYAYSRGNFAASIMNVYLYNNTVNDCGDRGIYFYQYNDADTINFTLENNICTNNTTDFEQYRNRGTRVGNNNCSEDDTADDWDGSGSITLQTPSDLFETVGSDHNLKTGSAAINAGKTISGFNWDAVGNTRSGTWDMGALEK